MILVMCIGNEMNGDDGIGPYIAKKFPDKKGFKVVNCETVPENFVHLAKDAKKVIVIDAVDMGLKAGEIRVIPPDKIKGQSFSTHSLPMSILLDFIIKEYMKDVILIGIQPKRLCGSMSEEVKEAGLKVIKLLIDDKIKEIEVLR